MGSQFARPSSFADLRQQAEARLAAASGAALAAVAAYDDPVRLVHELQVHQIELQMQNEALTEALQQADVLRSKYQELYESAPVGYLTLDKDGVLVELNERAAALLGARESRASVLGQPLRKFVSPACGQRLGDFLQAVLNSSKEVQADQLELSGQGVIPTYVDARAQASSSSASGQTLIRLVLVDVTALRMARDDVVRHLVAPGA
jgi:PAS domain S-box-containing protein